MKTAGKRIGSILFLILSFGILSCGDSSDTDSQEHIITPEKENDTSENEVENNNNEIINAPTSEVLVEESWQKFIAAVEANDQEGVQIFCDESITDMVGIMFLLREDYVLSEMKKTNFLDLPLKELDGEQYRQVYGEFIEIEEGIEYGSSVTLWFDVVDDQILLESYSAAG